MPPFQPDKPRLYSRFSVSLLKMRSLLDIIITMLLRMLLIVALFVSLVTAVFFILVYQRWVPTVIRLVEQRLPAAPSNDLISSPSTTP